MSKNIIVNISKTFINNDVLHFCCFIYCFVCHHTCFMDLIFLINSGSCLTIVWKHTQVKPGELVCSLCVFLCLISYAEKSTLRNIHYYTDNIRLAYESPLLIWSLVKLSVLGKFGSAHKWNASVGPPTPQMLKLKM